MLSQLTELKHYFHIHVYPIIQWERMTIQDATKLDLKNVNVMERGTREEEFVSLIIIHIVPRHLTISQAKREENDPNFTLLNPSH